MKRIREEWRKQGGFPLRRGFNKKGPRKGEGSKKIGISLISTPIRFDRGKGKPMEGKMKKSPVTVCFVVWWGTTVLPLQVPRIPETWEGEIGRDPAKLVVHEIGELFARSKIPARSKGLLPYKRKSWKRIPSRG